MTYPDRPDLGLLIEYTCNYCSARRFSPVVDYDRSGDIPNDDGSYCYTVQFECSACSKINGLIRPVWYNLYSKGVIC